MTNVWGALLKNNRYALTLFRQSPLLLYSSRMSHQPHSNCVANLDGDRLKYLIDQHPNVNVGLRSILEGHLHLDPVIHPLVQHAARSLDDLRRMTKAHGVENIQRHVYYVTPMRKILYNTIAFVCANVRTESVDHFYSTVTQCYQFYISQSLKDIQEKQQLSQTSRDHAEQNIIEFAKHGSSSDAGLNALIKSYRLNHPHASFSERSLLHDTPLMMACEDYLIKKQLADEIRLGMLIDNQRLFKQGVIQPIPMVLPSERMTYMICGAPATGKGVLTTRLITQKGLNLAETCRIQPDEWHHLLKTVGESTYLGLDQRYHGTLLREETLIIRNIITDSLLQRIKSHQRVPHCFMEMIIPTPERMAFATMGGGNLKCYLTAHNNLTKVVEGSLDRYNKTGRLVWPAAIVQSFHDVGRLSPDIIRWIITNQQGSVKLEVHDMTYIHEERGSSSTKPIYTVDSNNGKVVIYDLENKLRSYSKKFIDVKSKDSEGLYLKSMEKHLKEIVIAFKEDYQGVIENIVLIDPKLDVTKNNHHDQVIYAHFTKDGELVINNQEIYDRVIKESEISHVFLNEFNFCRYDSINTLS